MYIFINILFNMINNLSDKKMLLKNYYIGFKKIK